MKALEGKVIVLTGASSGIGRATAMALAKQKTKLVLAARREDDLEETGERCRSEGADVLVMPTDVTIEDDVRALYNGAIARFGHIDVWINNAGVTLFSPLADGPFDEHRRVIETNVYGAMYGARAVIPHFESRKCGTLVDVGSILSMVGQPFVPSYVVSKFALHGLSEAVRSQVAENPNIHVCTVLAYTVDTPHFDDGANSIGLRPRPLPPTQSPETVARAIVGIIEHPRREVVVPRIAALGIVAHWMFPRTCERLLLRALQRWHFEPNSHVDRTDGNLWSSTKPAHTHGSGPQIGTAAFALWCARELGKMALASASRPF